MHEHESMDLQVHITKMVPKETTHNNLDFVSLDVEILLTMANVPKMSPNFDQTKQNFPCKDIRNGPDVNMLQATKSPIVARMMEVPNSRYAVYILTSTKPFHVLNLLGFL